MKRDSNQSLDDKNLICLKQISDSILFDYSKKKTNLGKEFEDCLSSSHSISTNSYVSPNLESKDLKNICKKNININTKKDLIDIPIKSFLEFNNSDKNINSLEKAKCIINNQPLSIKQFSLTGEIIKKLNDSAINRFEKESIKEIKLSQKLFVPKVSTLKLCVDCPTVFGENLKITGNNDYLGNWQNYKDMTYSAGQWTFEIKLNTTNYENDIFSTNRKSCINSLYKKFGNFEFKFIIENQKKFLMWENTINRYFCLEEFIKKIEYDLFAAESNNINNKKDEVGYLNLQLKSDRQENSKPYHENIRESNFNNISESSSSEVYIYNKIKISENSFYEYQKEKSQLILYLKFNNI